MMNKESGEGVQDNNRRRDNSGQVKKNLKHMGLWLIKPKPAAMAHSSMFIPQTTESPAPMQTTTRIRL